MTTKYDVRAWPRFRQCLTRTRWRPHLSHTAVYAETVEVFATVPIFLDRIVEWHEGATQVAALEKERRQDRGAHSSLWHRQECPHSVPQGLRSVRTHAESHSVPSCFSFNKIIITLSRKHELGCTASCLKRWHCRRACGGCWDPIPNQQAAVLNFDRFYIVPLGKSRNSSCLKSYHNHFFANFPLIKFFSHYSIGRNLYIYNYNLISLLQVLASFTPS
jgi:hypothetical protein